MSDLIRKQELIDHLDKSANDLYERGGIVPAGVLVILRDSIEEGNFDADPDSEVPRLRGLYERERDIAEQAQGEVQRLREALETIASIQYKNLYYDGNDAKCMHNIAVAALSPQKGETPDDTR